MYQGTTSVVPKMGSKNQAGFSPCKAATLRVAVLRLRNRSGKGVKAIPCYDVSALIDNAEMVSK